MKSEAFVAQSCVPQFPWKVLLCFSILYLVVAGLLLPLLPIGGSSEAREAKVIDVVRSTGEWILPLRNGVVPSKPPLFHWIGALLAVFDGETRELTARRPSILAGLGVLWLVAGTVFRFTRLSEDPTIQQRATSITLVATAILSLTYGFYQMSTLAMVDMVFAFFVWLAIFATVLADVETWREQEKVSPGARMLFWCACAMAVVARGPVGLVLPTLLVGVGAFYCFGWRVTLRQFLTPSLGWLFFLVPATWYYLAMRQGGSAFVDRQLLFENVRRIVGGEHMNTQAWWFYLPSLLRTTFPWWLPLLLFLPSLITQCTLGGVVGSARPSERTIVRSVPLLCLVAGLVLFSIPAGKRHSYMLPLYPLVAVQAAIVLVESLYLGGYRSRGRLLRAVLVTNRVVVFLSIVLAAGVGFLAQYSLFTSELLLGLQPYLKVIAWPTATLLVLGVFPVILRREVVLKRELCAGWFALFILMSVTMCVGQGTKSAIKDYPGLTRRIEALIPSEMTVAVVKDPFEEYFDPILFYIRRDVTLVDVNQKDLPCSSQTVYIAKASVFEAARPRYQGKIIPIVTLREFGDIVRDLHAREIVVYRCVSGREYPSGPEYGGAHDVVATASFAKQG